MELELEREEGGEGGSFSVLHDSEVLRGSVTGRPRRARREKSTDDE
jgi:hypothetical protein